MTQQQLQQAILEITGITAAEYAEIVWDTGIRFAYLITNEDDWAVRAFTQTTEYWTWWKQHWATVDARILAQSTQRTNADKQFYKQQYLRCHQLTEMVATTRDAEVQHTYDNMTTKIWRELSKK